MDRDAKIDVLKFQLQGCHMNALKFSESALKFSDLEKLRKKSTIITINFTITATFNFKFHFLSVYFFLCVCNVNDNRVEKNKNI